MPLFHTFEKFRFYGSRLLFVELSVIVLFCFVELYRLRNGFRCNPRSIHLIHCSFFTVIQTNNIIDNIHDERYLDNAEDGSKHYNNFPRLRLRNDITIADGRQSYHGEVKGGKFWIHILRIPRHHKILQLKE